jgi:hypothetical protein
MLQELEDLRGTVECVAAILTLRPKLDAAYEQATAACWSVEELFAGNHEYGCRHPLLARTFLVRISTAILRSDVARSSTRARLSQNTSRFSP